MNPRWHLGDDLKLHAVVDFNESARVFVSLCGQIIIGPELCEMEKCAECQAKSVDKMKDETNELIRQGLQ